MTTKLNENKAHLSPDDVLDFSTLVDLCTKEFSCQKRKLALTAAAKSSPLYSEAIEGIQLFLKNEGIEKLNEIVIQGINVNIDNLIVNGIINHIIRSPE